MNKKRRFAKTYISAMKTRSLASLLAFSVSFCALAQFEINHHDQLLLGTKTIDISSVPDAQLDTITKIKIRGPYGEYAAGARIAFGDAASLYTLNVMAGEAGDTDTDRLWLHGKHGTCLTTGPEAMDTIFAYDDHKSLNLNFNHKIIAPAYLTKAVNIIPRPKKADAQQDEMPDVVALLNTLQAFRHTQPATASHAPAKAAAKGFLQKAAEDAAFYAALRDEAATTNEVYALRLDGLKEAFPALVSTDKAGESYIDYVGMIPLLVEAINTLSAEIAELRADAGLEPTRTRAAQAGINNAEAENPYLGQNTPNPCTGVSSIDYRLPKGASEACIYVYDLQGLQIKSYRLDTRLLDGTISVSADEYNAGMYIYTLIADGCELGTRRMIITR